ncbi:phosphatidylinositol-glycan biosynthesis class X protein [Nephila pilipes]|uniref:Phosphatidylinositol-glycan biosynthesis class X protein n=1 Tax=Nephila pilipes TaxID=299642 RepID=A0A8X6P9Z4_NEPPI|nr:phosphatidylinositol-glycan biosynthesis class X protein [Nephila pilipes]
MSTFSIAYSFGNKSQKHKSVVITRSILSAGFHRILQYNASIQGVEGPTQIVIKDTFPKDVYLDIYQISKRIEDNEIIIMSKEQINTEIPSYKADPFDVQFCSISSTNIHKFELPIHLRYQKPHECNTLGENILISLENLTLYFRPIVTKDFPDLKCQELQKYESWMEQKVQMVTSFQVPVGCTEHMFLVLFLTVGVISISTLYLCSVLIRINKK